MLEPRYHEECPECVFIGQIGKYDIYIHKDDPQIVARYGEYGDYLSGQKRLHLFRPNIVIERW